MYFPRMQFNILAVVRIKKIPEESQFLKSINNSDQTFSSLSLLLFGTLQSPPPPPPTRHPFLKLLISQKTVSHGGPWRFEKIQYHCILNNYILFSKNTCKKMISNLQCTSGNFPRVHNSNIQHFILLLSVSRHNFISCKGKVKRSMSGKMTVM